MKLIKMKINRVGKDGATHYTYPPQYDPQKVRFGPIYEGGLYDVVYSDILPRNADDEFILIGVDDADFVEFMKANGHVQNGFTFAAEEVNRTKSLEMGNKWTKRVEKIVDEAKVIMILAKVARKETLTQEEKNAIDPESIESGINKSASFQESLDKYLNLT